MIPDLSPILLEQLLTELGSAPPFEVSMSRAPSSLDGTGEHQVTVLRAALVLAIEGKVYDLQVPAGAPREATGR